MHVFTHTHTHTHTQWHTHTFYQLISAYTEKRISSLSDVCVFTCVCVCHCVCVLDMEGSRVLANASRGLVLLVLPVVVVMDTHVSDLL